MCVSVNQFTMLWGIVPQPRYSMMARRHGISMKHPGVANCSKMGCLAVDFTFYSALWLEGNWIGDKHRLFVNRIFINWTCPMAGFVGGYCRGGFWSHGIWFKHWATTEEIYPYLYNFICSARTESVPLQKPSSIHKTKFLFHGFVARAETCTII